MPGFLIGSDSGDGPSAIVETARSHRWEVILLGDDRTSSDELRFSAQSVSRPSFEADRIVMHHRQNELYLPGKTRTGTVVLALYERVSEAGINGAASVARQWWSEWMMTAKNHSINMGTNIQLLKKTVDTVQLDGCGQSVWTYRMRGAFPTKVEGSELDYSSTDLSIISITLSIDAFQEAGTF